MIRFEHFWLFVNVFARLGGLALAAPGDLVNAGPVRALSPEEELSTFQVPDGYRMELVVSERDGVKEPVSVTFDGDGRMYIAEMRSFMQDIAGANQEAKTGRVSRHERTKGNGDFDKHTAFADHLLLPRMVLPLDDRVLINETNTLDLYAYRDTKGTGVADQKGLAFAGGTLSGNMEHQPSGLIWAQDNWCYLTYQPMRLRFSPKAPVARGKGIWGWVSSFFSQPKLTGKGILVETTPPNGGEWGLAQDDYGKLWWSNGGAEIALYHFQTPIIYGAFDMPNSQPSDFPEVWPLVGIPDVQEGAVRYRQQDGTLNHFTAACGQEIFRGDRLPEDLRGDALVCEPVGRLIRRAKVELKNGVTTIRNAYDHAEFIRSTDPCFRPVNLANGPDGCLYIVDMYRGIVQESHWLQPGEYLYGVVQKYGLDKIVGCGRIWRLVHKDYAPGPWPHMLGESSAELVQHLEHPNGWWRDTAQKLLVLRQDKSVVPAVQNMAASSASHLGRIHALWTLEGLDALDASVIRRALKDPHPQVRIAALRAGESLCKNGDPSIIPDAKALYQDPAPEVVLQTLLTGKLLRWPDFASFADKALATTQSKGVKDLGMMILNESEGVGSYEFLKGEVELLERGQSIYQQVCFACHGFDGKGMPMDGPVAGTTLAPPLAGAREVLDSSETVVRILLHGLAGSVGGKTYPAQMISMAANDDVWIASVSSYVRNSFGNHGAVVTPSAVARLRSETKDRTAPWSIDELQALVPPRLANKAQWKAFASVNSEAAQRAIDGSLETQWNTGRAARRGDWFEIQLPNDTIIAGLRLMNPKISEEFPPGYEVRLSADGKNWGAPVASGHGTAGIAEIAFTPASARFIRVTNTRDYHRNHWSIDEAEVLLPAPSAKPGSE